MPVIPKVRSLLELEQKAKSDPRYLSLAKVAASNLGGPHGTLAESMRWLRTNGMETDEDGVVDEVNGCRDLVE
jgi:hypothetical protein